MSVYFSSRVDVSEANPIIALQRKMKAEGVALHQLNDSNPTHHNLTLAGLPQTYTAEPRGPEEARVALAKFLTKRLAHGGFDSDVVRAIARKSVSENTRIEHADNREHAASSVEPDQLYLASSTSEAYSWLMKLLCDPGDAVLCSTPGYPLISSLGRLENVEAITYPLRYDGSWVIDVPEVERLVRASLSQQTGESEQEQRTSAFAADSEDTGDIPPIRALILINPNNPSGSYVREDDYEQLIDICQRYDLPLIVDEVFFDYVLKPLNTPHRIAGEQRVLTFALDGFSKLLAAPHAKVGWIQVSGPSAEVEQAQKRLDVIADDFLPMSSLIAERIPELLTHVGEQVERVSARTHANLEHLEKLLATSETGVVSLLRSEGGWNVILRFPSVIDESELVTTLISRHQLTAQPGYFFDMPSNGYVCVSLLPEPELFDSSIRTLLATIDELIA
ncbi:pyridoxal phosphate-dependent aminotransferase [Aeriscardovia aeriphila]|uniref:Aminotransferase n=1 Tax=Aeriscardovia aeriphila TaxID=218139 RepID=A0A261FAW1_9BIFI|nr:pyridoxal phosphate-dependent aminotransferase [Aeriscardovia aeriphila]NYI25589.1 aspartate/methionine/tyrosine aminotransferase [Aeriscardovia aeriphila]OZG56262.1 aminotransferase [Aeriscardovia aeriphila]